MVSVCLATYNGVKYIQTQLDSILCQLSDEDEVIISDDGSSDGTLDIISGYADSRIKVFHHNHSGENNSPAYCCSMNFENALRHSSGDYIFISDQDDEWMPGKVDRCMELLQEYDFVIHEISICDEELRDCGGVAYGPTFRFKNYFQLGNGRCYGCSSAFRRKVLDWTLPFPTRLETYDFWLEIVSETNGSVCYTAEPFLKRRSRKDNLSYTIKRNFFCKVGIRLYLLIHLILRNIKLSIGK